MDERLAILAFSLFPGIGPKRFSELVRYFGSAESAWTAMPAEISPILKPALTEKFLRFKINFNSDAYLRQLDKKGIWYVTESDPYYPTLLKEISTPPLVLFGRGNKELLLSKKTIGVVGTRRITSYGRQVTEAITTELATTGVCIVSGLALGVDAVAHNAALDTKGTTIAVMGCGVDCCYPVQNQKLYNRIIASGSCVVSEFPMSQPPTVGSFPSRNRIIAGLSQGIVVTEGASDSGALITAHDAFVSGRYVFAVPGPITSQLSKGPNELLRKGGKLITGGEDVLRELGISESKRATGNRIMKGESEEEQRIIDILIQEEQSFDELQGRSSLSTARLNMLLSLMEMKGNIRLSERGTYYLI